MRRKTVSFPRSQKLNFPASVFWLCTVLIHLSFYFKTRWKYLLSFSVSVEKNTVINLGTGCVYTLSVCWWHVQQSPCVYMINVSEPSRWFYRPAVVITWTMTADKPRVSIYRHVLSRRRLGNGRTVTSTTASSSAALKPLVLPRTSAVHASRRFHAVASLASWARGCTACVFTKSGRNHTNVHINYTVSQKTGPFLVWA